MLIDYKSARFEDVIERPVHAVIDTVGGGYVPRSLGLSDSSGTYISLFASGLDLFWRIAGKLKTLVRLGPRYRSISSAA